MWYCGEQRVRVVLAQVVLFYIMDWMCFYSFFFFSSRRRHTRCSRDWSSDVCSSDLGAKRASKRAPVVFCPMRELPMGTRLMDSTPQAITMSCVPDMMACTAKCTA